MATMFCGSDTQPLYVHHVASLTGLSRRMVRHLAASGRLIGRKRGKKIWTFEKAEVNELLAGRHGTGHDSAR
jgi:hypothetical protein